MRSHGKLTRWNDDRGFGFISPAQGSEDLFVHISAFPRGTRPQIDELISFETEMGPNGKLRAVRVIRPRPSFPRRAPAPDARISGSLARAVLGCVLVLTLGVYAFKHFGKPVAATIVDTKALPRPATQTDDFRCDGRTTCAQMTSCEEAEYFLRHCPGTKMDGDRDGEPCERQWCN